MSKTTNRIATTDAEIDAAIAKSKVYDRHRPEAVRAAYRRVDDMILIMLASGVEVAIPRKLLQGLENATPAQAAAVDVEDFGSSLHWSLLDVDHYVPGLIDGVFGTRKWMSEIGKKGGASRSAAKTKAVRQNGMKGGRPRNPDGLNARYRDLSGRIRAKNGATRISALRHLYGDDFAAGFRSDMKLDTLLERAGVTSLSEFQKRQRRP